MRPCNIRSNIVVHDDEEPMVTTESPAVKYVSTLTACSCPDWHYRRRTPAEPCKHVQRLQDARALLMAQADHNRLKGISPRRTLPTLP